MPGLKPVGEQVVVVMGASSGIGRAAARRFAAKGAKLVVSARNEAALAALAAEIEADGGRVVAVPAEVTDVEQVRAVADAAVAAYGRLDTWVHLPAASVYARFDEHTPEEFRRVLEVGLLGQVHGAMAALPHLKREGRGALVHVTSAIARRSVPLQSSYAAAKRGTEGFLEALRTELRHDGIGVRVTNVMPASINTPFFDKARTRLGVKPMGPPPFYQPSVVAQALVHAAEHGPAIWSWAGSPCSTPASPRPAAMTCSSRWRGSTRRRAASATWPSATAPTPGRPPTGRPRRRWPRPAPPGSRPRSGGGAEAVDEDHPLGVPGRLAW